MITPARSALVFAFSTFFLLAIAAPLRSQTPAELLRRFDTNHDGHLDQKEFARALNELGIPVVTAKGASTAERVRTAINEGKASFLAQPRYRKRAAEAAKLLALHGLDGSNARAAAEDLYRDLPGLTTHERFVVRRHFSDLRYTTSSDGTTTTEPADGPLISFLENNFRIRQDSTDIYTDPVGEHPAKFSWTHSRGESSYYSIDGAVLYTPRWLDRNWLDIDSGDRPEEHGWLLGARIRPAFEAHVSTQTGSSQNLLRYSLRLEGRYKWLPGQQDNVRTQTLPPEAIEAGSKSYFSAHYLALVPVYITDRVASVRTWGFDLRYEPTVPWINLNHDSDKHILAGLSWLEGSMNGSLGIAYRSYSTSSGGMRDGDDYVAFVGTYGGSVTLFKRLILSADYSAMPAVTGNLGTHNFLTLSAQVLVEKEKRFTIGVDYKKGEEEPTFEQVDSVTAWVGVLF